MNYRQPLPSTSRWIPDIPLTTLIIVIATLAAAFGLPLVTPAPAPTTPPIPVLPNEQRGMLGEAGGAIPDGTTVFDDSIPGVANLNPALLNAVRQAATDASYEGITFFVQSGWRSPEYQNRLLRDAVAIYGSEAEAARWVATPNTSAHVSGDAIDIGSYDAMSWLAEYGTTYGLCQTYSNEPWHYELHPDASTNGCPPPYADPTQDPRMQP